MIVTWMVGSILFVALVAIAALAAERALVAAGRPRRWPWLLALAASTVWPLAAGVMFAARPPAVRLPTAVIGPEARSAVRTMAAQLPGLDASSLDAIGRAFIALWAVVTLLMLARLVVGVVRLRRVGATGIEREVDGMRVLVTDSVGPAVFGAINPRIVVPRWLFDLEPALRSLVLTHEHQHRARGDAAAIVAGAVATAMVPWNPAIWFMARRLRLAIELDCDSRVVASLPTTGQYRKLLLLIAQRQSHTGLVPMLAESNTHLETRITEMNKPRTSPSYVRAATFGAAALGVVAVACSNRVMHDVMAPEPMSATRASGLPQGGERVFFEFQVQKAVTEAPNTQRPRYPDILRQAGVEGVVLAQFVVDTAGLVLPGSLKILKSTHALFTAAVENASPGMRFIPAEVNGRKVRQLVQVPFVFAVARSGSALERVGPGSDSTGSGGLWILKPVKVTVPDLKKP